MERRVKRMSKYTTEVRYICESFSSLTESKGYSSVNEIIANSRDKIFDFDYPIFDETYRSVLETKILKHFYTREIGSETVGLWKLWLDTRMNEIMPYYNQRYKSAMLEFNPLLDVDLTTDRSVRGSGDKLDKGTATEEKTGSKSETGTKSKDYEGNTSDIRNRKNEGSNNASSSGGTNTTNNETGDMWNYYSDTPQGGITGLASETYLTNATHETNAKDGKSATATFGESNGAYTDTGVENDSSSKSSVENEKNDVAENNSSSANSTNETSSIYSNLEDYIEHIKGKTSGTSYSKMLEEFRKTFLNIDMEVIGELNDLFMNLW